MDQQVQPIENNATSRRILIVDDEAPLASALQQALEELSNCQVTATTSGEQALQLFEQRPFDLLITDYQMPNMDGLTLATRIRRSYPRTIVIILTAYADDALRQQAAHISVQRILEKPLELIELQNAVLEALEKAA